MKEETNHLCIFTETFNHLIVALKSNAAAIVTLCQAHFFFPHVAMGAFLVTREFVIRMLYSILR